MKETQILKDAAKDLGFSDIAYIGLYKNKQVFSVGLIDNNGFPLPTGLPVLMLLFNGSIEIVDGENSFSLLREFN